MPHGTRLYSIAASRYGDNYDGKTTSLCVRRATFWDSEKNAEDPAKKGICSNFLCDAKPGDEITMTGLSDLGLPGCWCASALLCHPGSPACAWNAHCNRDSVWQACSMPLPGVEVSTSKSSCCLPSLQICTPHRHGACSVSKRLSFCPSRHCSCPRAPRAGR